MTLGEYEALRENPAGFAVCRMERMLCRGSSGSLSGPIATGVVEKIGVAVAEAAEPADRSGSHAVSGGGSPSVIGNGRFELRFSNQASAATAARDARGRRFEVEIHQLGPHWRTFNRLVYDFPNDEQDRYASPHSNVSLRATAAPTLRSHPTRNYDQLAKPSRRGGMQGEALSRVPTAARRSPRRRPSQRAVEVHQPPAPAAGSDEEAVPVAQSATEHRLCRGPEVPECRHADQPEEADDRGARVGGNEPCHHRGAPEHIAQVILRQCRKFVIRSHLLSGVADPAGAPTGGLRRVVRTWLGDRD